MNIFMKRILSILPWVTALLVIRAIKIKKINRELKTLEQLEEKNIDENNYSIQEEGWLGILFLVGTIFFSGLLLYGFIELIPVIFLFFTIRTFTASTVEPNFVYLSVV